MLASGKGYKSDCHEKKMNKTTIICVCPPQISMLLTLGKIILSRMCNGVT